MEISATQPSQPCFGEKCPQLRQHVTDMGRDPESAADRADIVASCSSMTGPTGRPGEAGYQCGIMGASVLYDVTVTEDQGGQQ